MRLVNENWKELIPVSIERDYIHILVYEYFLLNVMKQHSIKQESISQVVLHTNQFNSHWMIFLILYKQILNVILIHLNNFKCVFN